MDIGQQLGQLAERMDALTDDVRQLIEAQRRTEAAVARWNGGE